MNWKPVLRRVFAEVANIPEAVACLPVKAFCAFTGQKENTLHRTFGAMGAATIFSLAAMLSFSGTVLLATPFYLAGRGAQMATKNYRPMMLQAFKV